MGNDKDKPIGKQSGDKQLRNFTPLVQWHVLLRHVQRNEIPLAIKAIKAITRLDHEQSMAAAFEANEHGIGFIICTHYELAEHYMEQFSEYKLMATLEPMDVLE